MTTAVLAQREEEEGVAILDGGTLLEFLVGFATGMAKVEPHVAVIGILAFEAGQEMAMHGKGELFRRQHGESYANRIVDAIALVSGVLIGHYVRDAADRSEQAMLQQLPAAPMPVPAPPVVAGYF